MKIAIVGTRDWTNTELVRRTVRYIAALDINSIIVSGGKPHDPTYKNNVDEAAENAADEYELAKFIFPAKWNHYETLGKRRAAGPIRNQTIADESDICISFWDNASKGTWNCLSHFIEQDKPYLIVHAGDIETTQRAEIKGFLDKHLKGSK